jgi:DNA-binding NtrC family response regulator
MRQVIDHARAAAERDATVLLSGEPGTGKGLVAEMIHRHSSRRDAPFVSFDVRPLPARLVERELFGFAVGPLSASEPHSGRFDMAADGTLFIDDVADLAPVTQSRLLRALDHRLIDAGGAPRSIPDARVIVGTARKLEVLAAEGRFSMNLLRRISGIQIRLPPLRERREDIPLLVDHLLWRTCEAVGRPVPKLEPELLRFFERFDWPTNVRQLSDCLETMVALSDGDVLLLNDLPASVDESTTGLTGMYFPAGMSLAELERAAVEQALAHCGGNRTRAAERLGISVRTLQRKLKSWSLQEVEPVEHASRAT